MMTTTQATIALAGKAFPFEPAARSISRSTCPSFSSFKPANGAVFSSTNDVLVAGRVHATPRAAPASTRTPCASSSTAVNKTKSAKVYSSSST